MMKRVARYLAGFTAAVLAAAAQPADCNAPAPVPSVTDALPTSPFAVAPTRDGCWLFVSGFGGGGRKSGIAVMRRNSGLVALAAWFRWPATAAAWC
jgi:hypothetical protein